MSPCVGDLDLLQHLANDHLDVLVVDHHALQPVDFLDLVDEVGRQRLHALDRQDVVRRRIAVEDVVALLDDVAFLQMEGLPFGIRYSTGSTVLSIGSIDDAALVLVVAAEADRAVDLGDDRRVLRTRASNSSATRGRPPVMSLVLALSVGIRASTSPALTCAPVLDRQNGLDREQVAGVAARASFDTLPSLPLTDDRRLQVRCRRASRASR